MEIIARTAYRVIAMHRSQYGSSLAAFDFCRCKKVSLDKNGAFKISVTVDTRHAGLATD